MQTPKSRTAPIEIFKNYLPAIGLTATGFVSLVLAWKDISDNKKNITILEDRVSKQYATQREMNDKTNKEVETLKLWVEFQKGVQEGRKQLSEELKK